MEVKYKEIAIEVSDKPNDGFYSYTMRRDGATTGVCGSMRERSPRAVIRNIKYEIDHDKRTAEWLGL